VCVWVVYVCVCVCDKEHMTIMLIAAVMMTLMQLTSQMWKVKRSTVMRKSTACW